MAAPMKTRKGVLSSLGAGDAGKVPLLGDNGKLDGSFLPVKDAQSGTSTAPSSGSHSTVLIVTFVREFSSAPVVLPVLRQAAICTAGLPGVIAVTAVSASSFTVKIDTNVDDDSSGYNINAAPVFDWVAFEL